MVNTAIHVEKLGKRYNIGANQKTYNRFGEQVVDALTGPIRRFGNLLRGQPGAVTGLHETIWAVKDVTFTIKQGEVVGVIGRNGAGKSTLLKILSNITEPTEGYADIYGRISSLLEVGTGFHPELTGRENVYLNGAILGMKKREIDRKFDQIVEFAEIDQFIDTPVKHYSSGMYVRLAFSVAAHLETEILLVDEVLAVGDIAFQKKCLGKMDDVAHQGRTVLFVSHNMGVIQKLCTRGIFLDKGGVAADGPISDVVDVYLRILEGLETPELDKREDRRGLGKVRLTGIEFTNGTKNPSPILKTGAPARFAFHVDRLVPGMFINFSIYDQFGQPVVNFRSKDRSSKDVFRPDNGQTFFCDIDQLLLLPGHYRMDVSVVGENQLQDHIEAAALFDVTDGFIDGRQERDRKRFNVSIPHRWTLPVKE